MNKKQENKLTMYKATNQQLKSGDGILTENPALSRAQGDLENKIGEIHIKSQEKSTATSGRTQSKYAAKNALVNSLLMTAKPAFAWAVEKGNQEMMSICKVNKSDLQEMRDTSLSDKGQIIVEKLQQISAELADYSITEEKISDLNNKLQVYDAALGEKESGMAQRVSATATLSTLFREADDILKLRIDQLIEAVKKDHADFYNAYKAARVIKDLRGSGKRQTVEEVAAETAAASGSQY